MLFLYPSFVDIVEINVGNNPDTVENYNVTDVMFPPK